MSKVDDVFDFADELVAEWGQDAIVRAQKPTPPTMQTTGTVS